MASTEKILKYNQHEYPHEYQHQLTGEPRLPFQGLISCLMPERNYGIIVTADGLEVYFLRTSVLDHTFDMLKPGDRVCFNLSYNVLGLQARQVKYVEIACNTRISH